MCTHTVKLSAIWLPLLGRQIRAFSSLFQMKYRMYLGSRTVYIRLPRYITYYYVLVKHFPRKKTSLGERLAQSHAYNPIRDSGETRGEREKSRQKSYRESWLDSWWDSRQDSWRDFSRSPSVSPESQIGLYARLSARLSLRLVFYAGSCPSENILRPRVIILHPKAEISHFRSL